MDSSDSYKESVPGGGGGGIAFIWSKWGCAAGQGMVFVLSLLNRVCHFA